MKPPVESLASSCLLFGLLIIVTVAQMWVVLSWTDWQWQNFWWAAVLLLFAGVMIGDRVFKGNRQNGSAQVQYCRNIIPK